MRWRAHHHLVLTSWLTLAAALPSKAYGDAPSAEAKAEARDRFDRGLLLFARGNHDSALAEFKRAYEVTSNPLVLFNMGLVYTAMNRPVEATDAWDRLLAAPGAVPRERLAQARQLRAEQAARVAELLVRTSVPATLQVDNIDAATTPQQRPLRVSSGAHVIAAVAPGYLPVRREITVAGSTKTELSFDLVPMEGSFAHLKLVSKLPGVELWMDRQLVGKTPLAQSLAVPPGAHILEMKREGYMPRRLPLELGNGASAEATVDLEVDPLQTALSGHLQVEVREQGASWSIDGRRGNPGMTLPKGPHQLVVEHSGFLPYEREISVVANQSTVVRVELIPTADTRSEHLAHVESQRTWGWVASTGGALVLGSSMGFLLYNKGQKQDAESDLARIQYDSTPVPSEQRRCDPTRDIDNVACARELADAKNHVNSTRSRDVIGYVGLGVGAAAMVTGIYLLLTAREGVDEAAVTGLHISPRPWGFAGPAGGGLSLDFCF